MDYSHLGWISLAVVVVWVMFIPVDRGLNSGWDLPLGIRGLVWLIRWLRRRLQ